MCITIRIVHHNPRFLSFCYFFPMPGFVLPVDTDPTRQLLSLTIFTSGAADNNDLSLLSLQHVRKNSFGQRNLPKQIDVQELLLHFKWRFFHKKHLKHPSVVDQDIDLLNTNHGARHVHQKTSS